MSKLLKYIMVMKSLKMVLNNHIKRIFSFEITNILRLKRKIRGV